MQAASALPSFENLVAPHRRGLLAHCYRMLGSWTDAEDVLQEALLKAWQGLPELRETAALRSWMYQVATNACLSALRAHQARSVPQLASVPVGADTHVGAFGEPDAWVEPFPDAEAPDDMASAVEARESVALGFILALQHLPPKQRAVLLLSEVVGYRAAEVAEMLGGSVTAVNSALARARVTLERARGDTSDWGPVPALGEEDRRALERYRAAWEAGDVGALVALLSKEATFSMPPISTWYRGPRAAGAAMAEHVFEGGRHFKTVPVVAAGGMPAFVLLKADGGSERYAALGVQLVWIRRGKVRRVVSFLVPKMAERFLKLAQRRVSRRRRV
ncbi:MAG TPA: RNA polymerase subunit sigma-70 [Myxococcaceae bacterium]|nr:RNA polymerase subunit sigma-70 [Myxococcaceae bacterium]